MAFEQRNTAGGWVDENAPIDVPDSQVGPLDSEGRLMPFDDGRLLAVWIEFGAHDGGTRRVRHGIRPAAGGTWEPIHDTAIWIGDGASPVPTGLEAGVTDAGQAIAAWYAPDDAGARSWWPGWRRARRGPAHALAAGWCRPRPLPTAARWRPSVPPGSLMTADRPGRPARRRLALHADPGRRHGHGRPAPRRG